MTGDILHGALDLLDRQIIDADDELVGKVDDLELSDGANGSSPRVVAILLGPQAYGGRLGGRLGKWIASAGSRLGGTKEPLRIPFDVVAEIGVSVRLKVRSADIDGLEAVEEWFRDNFIGRIPGAKRASE